MISTPAATPVTTPEVPPTVAFAPELLQVPPAEASDKVIVAPGHTSVGPETGAGNGFTVSGIIVRQPPPNEYVMVTTPVATPLTSPAVSIIATPGLLLLHVPPGVASVNVMVPNTQTLLPVLGPAIGNGEEITDIVTVTEQPVDGVYTTGTVPDETPVTIPVTEPTVAMEGLPLAHVPPVIDGVKVDADPTHTVVVPLITGKGFTVTVAVFLHPVRAVYDMVTVPPLTPVTMPLLLPIVAIAGLPLLHMPPLGDAANVVFDPWHTIIAPAITGLGLTVTLLVALQPVGSV
jgi:hypothetical protein